jgi:hypothetical protein
MAKTKNIPSKKFGGKHTSFIPTAETIVNILAKCELVTNISSGIISSYRGKNGGRKHVKITDDDSGILLAVTDNCNNQKVRIYTKETEVVRNLVIKKSEEKGFTTS